MPIFDFRCDNCEEEFEAILHRSDSEPFCPQCGSSDVHKIFKEMKTLGRVESDNAPRNDRDLRNYLGNGQYNKGYKRGS